MGLFDIFTDIPIVGDLAGGLLGHASQSELQEDAQAFSAQQYERQKAHDIDMFGRESKFASAEALNQYERQRSLISDSPQLQTEGLKKAGLNPILAATGGFKSPAGGSLPIPTARASSSAKGASTSSGGIQKVVFGEARLKGNQAKLVQEQQKTEKELQSLHSANALKSTNEAYLASAKNEAQLMENIRLEKKANVYDDAFGQFLTYVQEIGLDKIATLAAVALGGPAVARYLVGRLGKNPKHLERIKSLGRRFWNPEQYRKFERTLNNLRGK